MKEIAVILFNGFETLDVFGPVEVFGRLKDHLSVEFYSRDGGVITSSHNVKVVTKPFSEMATDGYILMIPGGAGVAGLIRDNSYISDLKKLSEAAEYILTVCTGSVLLSKTGLLDGRNATSNKRLFGWGLSESPAVNWIKKARWVKDGSIYTSSGISAGIDMALGFVSDLLGYDVAKQQSIEIEYQWNENADYDRFADIY